MKTRMTKRKATPAQIRDRRKTQDLNRIADALEELVFLAKGTIESVTSGAIAAYKIFRAGQPPDKVQ